MYKISDKDIKFIEKTMKTWRVELTSGVKSYMKQRSREEYSWEMYYHHYDVDRLYVSRKGGRGLTSIEDSVDACI